MTTKLILNHIKNDQNLKYLVGARIFRGRIPQNPRYPLIMYSTEKDNENSLSGNDGVIHYEFAFELYGRDYEKLEEVAAKLKTALSTSSTFKSLCVSEADDDYQDDNKLYSIFMDFSIWF